MLLPLPVDHEQIATHQRRSADAPTLTRVARFLFLDLDTYLDILRFKFSRANFQTPPAYLSLYSAYFRIYLQYVLLCNKDIGCCSLAFMALPMTFYGTAMVFDGLSWL